MDEMKKLIIDGQEFEVVDAAGRQRITVLENTAPSGGGLSITEKNLILQLFNKAAYAEDDAGTAYATLSNLWTGSYHSVAWEGTGYTHENSDVAVEDGESFTSTVTANNGKTIESVTVTMGGETVQGAYSSGTITIPNVTGDIVITVTTAQMTVSSISAVYTQSGTVYDTDALDSLKADLVVTATFPDSSTAVIDSADYTLSGTLLEGTSTITVSYGGKTASFNVTVSHDPMAYPITITETDDGVGFGPIDISKNTLNPPYISATSKNRLHCIGDNTGYPVTYGKSYRITISGNLGTEGIIPRCFNGAGKTQLENVQAVTSTNTNEPAGTWNTFTNQQFTFTPTLINGTEPVCMWLNMRKSSANAQWNALSEMLPITIEELSGE